MPFVTTLSLQSGDRAALDGVVEEIREVARRKGVELRGPHTHPPIDVTAPQHRTTTADAGEFDPWEYAVYERTVRIVGHEEIARQIAGWDFPPSVRVEVEIEQVRSAGGG